jgi:NAD(P)H-hydrate epimerase
MKKLNSNWILTPHEGELARLLKVNSILVKKNRLKYALQLHEKYGCHILLKGPECILIDDQGNAFSTKFGNSALAKAGTGDVLTGIIAAQLNLKLNSLKAMIVGNYIHGQAANKYIKMGNNERSLRPTDLIDLIPKIISHQKS